MSLFMHLVTMNIMKEREVIHMLSISECTNSQKLKVEKEKKKAHVTDCKLYQNDKHSEAEESGLPPEDKRMHKFTKVASGEREKQSSCE